MVFQDIMNIVIDQMEECEFLKLELTQDEKYMTNLGYRRRIE
jgi:hypothetical protein